MRCQRRDGREQKTRKIQKYNRLDQNIPPSPLTYLYLDRQINEVLSTVITHIRILNGSVINQ